MSVRVVRWVIAHAPYEGNEYTALLLLAIHADDDGAGDMPKLDLFAEQCRVGRATVYRLLDRLEAGGAIAVEHRRGRGVTNRFTVVTEPKTSHSYDTYQKTSHDSLPYQSKTSHLGETLNETFLPTTTRTSALAPAAQDSVDPVDSVVLGESTTTTRGSGPARGNGVITPAQAAKVNAVRDDLSERQLPDILTGKDKQKIAACDADAGTIVDAYAALLANKWGDAWVRGNKSPGVAADNISTYLAWTQRPEVNPTMSGQAYLASEMADEMDRLLGRTSLTAGPDVPRLPGRADNDL